MSDKSKSKLARELEAVQKTLSNLELRLESCEAINHDLLKRIESLNLTPQAESSSSTSEAEMTAGDPAAPDTPPHEGSPAPISAEQLQHNRLSLVGQMASSLAHELSRPLANILTYAQALLRLVPQETTSKDDLVAPLERIVAQAQFGANFIQRLRRFLANNQMQRESVHLNELVQEVLHLCEAEFRDNSITLELQLDQSLPKLELDRLGIQQVIINLVRNAMDAMTDTPVDLRRLTISTAIVDDEVRLSVADTGKGLSVDTIHDLFQPFHTTKAEGMGVGLSLCREIMQQHDGRISGQQNPERGVTFFIALPLTSGKDNDPNGSTAVRLPRGR